MEITKNADYWHQIEEDGERVISRGAISTRA